MYNWDKTRITAGQTYCFSYGYLQVFIKKNSKEMLIRSNIFQHFDESTSIDEKTKPAITFSEMKETVDFPDDWQRLIVEEKDAFVQFKPALPDRPVVIKTNYQLNILPDSKAVFLVSLPIKIDLYVNEKKATSFSSIKLTNTWFGDPVNGQFCYGKKSTLKIIELKEVKKSQNFYTFNCPIIINNTSENVFKFIRICIPPDFLNIYTINGFLWTDEIMYTVQGDEQKTSLDYSNNFLKENNMKFSKIAEAISADQKASYKQKITNLFSR